MNELDVHVTFPYGISIVAQMAFPEMIKEDDKFLSAVKAIAVDPFFDGIEFPKPPDDLWDKVEDLVEEEGKVAILAGQPEVLNRSLNLSNLDDAERKLAVDNLGKMIEDAGAHGVWLIALCSGPDPGAPKRKDAKNKMVDSLKQLCERADGCGINLLIETFDRTLDKKLLIGPMEEAVEIVSEVRKDYDNIGVMWDLSHGPLIGEKPGVLTKAGELLEHIHIGCAERADTGGLVDHHPGFYSKNAVNTSDDVADLLKVLSDVNYFGLVGFEVKPRDYQTSQEVISTAKSVLLEGFQKAIPRILAK
jgi:sugar phosphate isomerase/epimerase